MIEQVVKFHRLRCCSPRLWSTRWPGWSLLGRFSILRDFEPQASALHAMARGRSPGKRTTRVPTEQLKHPKPPMLLVRSCFRQMSLAQMREEVDEERKPGAQEGS